jgi:hypothetical protein
MDATDATWGPTEPAPDVWGSDSASSSWWSSSSDGVGSESESGASATSDTPAETDEYGSLPDVYAGGGTAEAGYYSDYSDYSDSNASSSAAGDSLSYSGESYGGDGGGGYYSGTSASSESSWDAESYGGADGPLQLQPPPAADLYLTHADELTAASQPSYPDSVITVSNALAMTSADRREAAASLPAAPAAPAATQPAAAPAALSSPPLCPYCERACEPNNVQNQLGMYWRKFGYRGPKYCSRCASVFRAHTLNRTVQSKTCNREQPCHICLKIMGNINRDRHDLYAELDSVAEPRNTAEPATPSVELVCPVCSNPASRLQTYWKK